MRDDFELDGWTVRPSRLILEREGRVVHVKPKTMEVFAALADCRGDVLSREQLLERVWENRYVSDDVITQAIAELRRALGDDFRHPVFVETVPRRGYRLIPDVRQPIADPLPSLDTLGDAAAQLSWPPTLTPDAIRRTPDARSSVPRPFARPVFASVVFSAVALAGWMLVRAPSDTSDSQGDEQAGRHEVQGGSAETRPTRDTEAYELYLKALKAFQPYHGTAEGLDEALTFAKRAAARDPRFAEAHALIAEILTINGFWNRGPRDEILTAARHAADAALEIDPHLSYPHAVSGMATAVLEWKWEEGYRKAVRATELGPNDARSLSLRAALALTRGKSAEAVQVAYRAYELEPISPHALGILSWVLYQARHFDKAAEFMGKTLEADPDALFARNFRPLALARAGRYDEALAASRALTGGRPSSLHPEILALAGRRAEARLYLLQQRPRSPDGAWALLGDTTLLVERLDSLYEQRMTSYLMWLRTAPAWDTVRDHPRFHEVLAGVGLLD